VLFEAGFIKISPAQLLAIVTIILLTYINTRGVNEGKWIQSVLTTVKLLSLFGLIVAGFFAFKPEVWQANWQDAWSMKKLLPDGRIETYLTIGALGAIASAMVGSIFSSDAWNNVTFIAGEIRNPQRNIGLSLFLGTLIVTVIYVSANFMYTGILPLNEIAFAENDRVGVATSTVIFGAAGTIVIAIMIMVSTFGCNNGLILSGARVYYTMAKDGLFFKQAGELNQASVPQKALWMQGVLASVWCLSGRYGDLLDMISFVVVLFYMLTIAGIFILRKKQPNMARPYKAFGYPLLPFIYMLMGTAFCMLLIVYKPQYTWPGFIITLLGIPLYYLALRNKQSKGVVK
jgi:APA family basic amino acid/polyamine antiporter